VESLLLGQKWVQVHSFLPQGDIFRGRVFRRLLIWLLIGLFLTVGIPPALSQLPATNLIFQNLANPQSLVQQGESHYQAGQFPQAVDNFQQAANAFAAQQDELNQAKTLANLSLAYQQLAEWDKAEKAITQSLNLLGLNTDFIPTEVTSDVSNSQLGILAPALDIYGRGLFLQGKSAAALDSWRLAANIFKKLANPERMIGSQINQVQALQTLGLYQEARQTIELLKATLNQKPDSLLKAQVLHSLGDLLRTFGNLQESENVLKDSIAIAEKFKSNQDIAAVRLSLGNTLFASGNRLQILNDNPIDKYEYMPWRCDEKPIPDAAVDDYTEASNTYKKVNDDLLTLTSSVIGNKANINRLNVLLKMNRLSEAKTLGSEIQVSNLPKSRTAVYAKINLAKNLVCLRHKYAKFSSEAATQIPSRQTINDLLEMAVHESEELGDTRATSYAIGNLAGLYEYWGWLDEQQNQTLDAQKFRQKAQQLTTEALLLAQPIKAPDMAYQWQWQLARLFKAQDQRKEAREAYTQTVKIIDNFRKDLGGVAFNIEEQNSDIQFDFRENIEPIYRQFIDLLLQPKGTQPSPKDVEAARQLIQKFQVAELENFLLCNLQPNRQQLSVDNLITTNNLQAAIVYPIIFKDKIGIILKLPNQDSLYYQSQAQANLLEPIEALPNTLKNSSLTKTEVRDVSHNVYNLLIKPIENTLAESQVKTLVFLLDSPLRNIPMAALYDGNDYLIRKYAVVLSTGLPLRDSKPLHEIQLDSLIVAVKEPKYKTFSSLPGVEAEVKQIQPLLNAKVFFDQDQAFGKQELKDELSSSPHNLVHLATHAQFSFNLKDTFILAAPGEPVQVNELGNLLQARTQSVANILELLVLSACQTASGDKRAALGLAGVAVQTGANSTLATLWTVDDGSTADFMARFYKKLIQDKVSKVEALRLVQEEFLDEDRKTTAWAPYILVGNWR
jgi:CHAT domain-containing protein